LIAEQSLVVKQMVKFGLVGVLNTGIHYATFYVLFAFFGVHYLYASVIGYLAGLINSYFLNRGWTFQAGAKKKSLEFTQFVLVNLIALGVNLAVLELFVGFGGIRPEVAQIFAILFSLTANFLGNKFWTFRSVNRIG
jgi:putative flippase GtrA